MFWNSQMFLFRLEQMHTQKNRDNFYVKFRFYLLNQALYYLTYKVYNLPNISLKMNCKNIYYQIQIPTGSAINIHINSKKQTRIRLRKTIRELKRIFRELNIKGV